MEFEPWQIRPDVEHKPPLVKAGNSKVKIAVVVVLLLLWCAVYRLLGGKF